MTSDGLDDGRAHQVRAAPIPRAQDARAYGGPAHGQEWSVEGDQPPSWVELPTGASSCLYRLARHPRTGRPARDPHGNYLYVPIAAVPTRQLPADVPRVLPFPPGGRAGRRRD
jgi:hypothetical protein